MGSERGGAGSVSQPSGQVRLLDPHALLSDKWLLEDIPAGSLSSWRVWTGLSITQARAFTWPPWGCVTRGWAFLLKKKIKHSLSELLISQSASGFLGSRGSPSLTSTFPSDHPHPIPLPNSLFQNKNSLLCCKDPGLGSAWDRCGALQKHSPSSRPLAHRITQAVPCVIAFCLWRGFVEQRKFKKRHFQDYVTCFSSIKWASWMFVSL